jgi:hypothetical protein
MNHIETTWSRRWAYISQEQRIEAIAARRDAGMHMGQIAESLAVGRTNLKAFCLRHDITGIKSDGPTGDWYDLTVEQKVEAIRARSAGNPTVAELAADLGVAPNTLYGFMWRQGLRDATGGRITISSPPPEAFVDADPVDPAVWQPIDGSPRTLEDNDGCSWPVDTPEGQRCCGARKHNRSYCEAHYAIAYRPSAAVSKSAEDRLASLNEQGGKRREVFAPTGGKKAVWRGEE